MIFNSITFILFFIATSALYFALPHKRRWCLLLAASYFFYGSWNVKYTALMAVTTITSWICGEALSRSDKALLRKSWVFICLVVNLSILALFKYHVMIAESVNAIMISLGSNSLFQPLDVLLPVGISFYTFQAMGYMLDVYRDSNKVEHHPGYFALYISFFPQLVAGPIERAHNILPQLREKTSFNLERTSQGLALALWGYFKKLAIADRLGLYVDQIYAAPTDYSALQTCMATLFFSFQIYCDFSAYTDIARGVSHVFGIRLMENFQTPYFATSIQDFWRRWHISLSSWFRDYVYIPLGGSKQTTARTMFNVLFVFAICGLWHGAAWNFMLWGLSHGLLLVLSMLIALPSTRKATPQSPPPGLLINISKTIVIFTLVTLAWVLFRTRDLTHAAVVYERMYCIFSEQLPIQETGLIQGAKKLLLSLAPDGNTHSVILSCFFLIILLALDLARSKKDYLEWYGGLATFSRWCLCYFLFFSTVIFGRLGISQFIYFQF